MGNEKQFKFNQSVADSAISAIEKKKLDKAKKELEEGKKVLSERQKLIKGQMNQKIDIFSFVALPSSNTKKNHPK